MAKLNKANGNPGAEKIDKLDAKAVDTKIDDTGAPIVTPWDPKTGPAAADKVADKTNMPGAEKAGKLDKTSAKGSASAQPNGIKPSAGEKIDKIEKKKKVAEALIGLEDMDSKQMAKLSAMLEAFKDDDKDKDDKDKDDEVKETDDDDDKDKKDVKEAKDDDDDDKDKDDEVKETDDKDTEADDKDKDAAEKKKFPFKKEDITLDLKEDVDAMFDGQDLSTEFISKATVVFESAIVSRINGIVDTLQEAWTPAIDAGVEAQTIKLEEKLSSYMQYVSEEFIKENELAIEAGIRTDITEEFIKGFRVLCEEHNIDIPAEQVDALVEAKKDMVELEKKFTTVVESNIYLNNQINESVRTEILTNVGDGLAATEKEKLIEICESIDFENKDSFTKKAIILKESYFPLKTSKKSNDDLITEDVKVAGAMSKYTQTISKDLKNA